MGFWLGTIIFLVLEVLGVAGVELTGAKRKNNLCAARQTPHASPQRVPKAAIPRSHPPTPPTRAPGGRYPGQRWKGRRGNAGGARGEREREREEGGDGRGGVERELLCLDDPRFPLFCAFRLLLPHSPSLLRSHPLGSIFAPSPPACPALISNAAFLVCPAGSPTPSGPPPSSALGSCASRRPVGVEKRATGPPIAHPCLRSGSLRLILLIGLPSAPLCRWALIYAAQMYPLVHPTLQG